MPRTRSSRLLRAGLIGLALTLLLGAADPRCTERGTLYVLRPGSSFLEGCIGALCLCPVSITHDVHGVFWLEELPTLQPGPLRMFGVRKFRALVQRGHDQHVLTGSGLYITGAPVLDEERLILDLRIDEGPVESYDSDRVEGTAFPSIEIEVSTEEGCPGRRLGVVAEPLLPYDTAG